MLKGILNFLVWAVSAILLYFIWALGHSGNRGLAIGGLVILFAIMVLWNWRRTAQVIRTNRIAGILNIGQWVVWLVAISIVTGIFGRSPYLNYLLVVVVTIGGVMAIRMRLIVRKVDNSN
jgi:hypothetical protein